MKENIHTYIIWGQASTRDASSATLAGVELSEILKFKTLFKSTINLEARVVQGNLVTR